MAGPRQAGFWQSQIDLRKKNLMHKPKQTIFFAWCAILAVLKKDILGQELDPVDIIRVMVNDYDSNIDGIEEAKKYLKTYYKETYDEDPYWI